MWGVRNERIKTIRIPTKREILAQHGRIRTDPPKSFLQNNYISKPLNRSVFQIAREPNRLRSVVRTCRPDETSICSEHPFFLNPIQRETCLPPADPPAMGSPELSSPEPNAAVAAPVHAPAQAAPGCAFPPSAEGAPFGEPMDVNELKRLNYFKRVFETKKYIVTLNRSKENINIFFKTSKKTQKISLKYLTVPPCVDRSVKKQVEAYPMVHNDIVYIFVDLRAEVLRYSLRERRNPTQLASIFMPCAVRGAPDFSAVPTRGVVYGVAEGRGNELVVLDIPSGESRVLHLETPIYALAGAYGIGGNALTYALVTDDFLSQGERRRIGTNVHLAVVCKNGEVLTSRFDRNAHALHIMHLLGTQVKSNREDLLKAFSLGSDVGFRLFPSASGRDPNFYNFKTSKERDFPCCVAWDMSVIFRFDGACVLRMRPAVGASLPR
eukprot:gnl/Chilomastix_cuspidata/4950.p1 GENE.gnl/Chilomastix_cuspidata/4950~~gnl/Chilomastix_cuspidata/4950.p1  ORF type:complete len:438 (+),score=23.25 gnl/Chilomastix_cuspidata/4950:165-1478(+)